MLASIIWSGKDWLLPIAIIGAIAVLLVWLSYRRVGFPA